MNTTKSLETELQETKNKLSESKQIVSELSNAKKHAQQVQTQLDNLQAQYEAEKTTAAQMLESYNVKYTNAEQKLLEALKNIADLESAMVVLREENEKQLKDIQGVYS